MRLPLHKLLWISLLSQLHKFQQNFHAAISGAPCIKSLEAIIKMNGFSAQRRLNVYKNNFEHSLASALKSTYPAISALIGEQLFNAWANQYVKQYPSTTGNLHHYGNNFSSFIRDNIDSKDLPYLADIAEFEWFYHEVFHEVDAEEITIEALSNVDPNHFNNIVFILHPASRQLHSSFPLIDIWRLGNNLSTEQVDLDSGGVSLLIARRSLVIEFQKLDQGDSWFLQLLTEGKPLGEIVDTISTKMPDFNIQECLQRQFQRKKFFRVLY